MDVRVKIGSYEFLRSDAELAQILENAHTCKQRPLCLCKEPGLPMYIAKANSKFILKRMPNSGPKHAPHCDSFEAPPELSGMGEVIGHAVQEDAESGTTQIKIDFALSKHGKRGPAAAGGESEKESVRTDGSKLSFRGLLHYLWSQAEFDRWVPAMESKRTWYVIRKYLLEAITNKQTKGMALSDVVFIPEQFNVEHKNAIEARQRQSFAKIFSSGNGKQNLMLLIGELKEYSDARYGEKLLIKHMPNTPLMLNDDIGKRLKKHFADELALWNYLGDKAHAIVIATVCRTSTGIMSVEQLAVMVTTSQWIPLENIADQQLIELLIKERRRFIKGLRVNMARSKPMATAMLTDTGDEPTALFISADIETESETDEDEHADSPIDQLIASSTIPTWVWNIADESIPALPPRIKQYQPEVES